MLDTESTVQSAAPTIDKEAALFAALAEAQGHAQSVAKDSENKFHHYNYASAEAMIREAKESLSLAKLAVIPMGSKVERLTELFGNVEGKGGAVGFLHAEWVVVHAAGGRMHLTTQWPIAPEKGRPIDKAVAAARTASLGYLLRDLLQLPRVEEGTGLDDDSRDNEQNHAAQKKREMEEAKARAMAGGNGATKAAPVAKPDEDEVKVKGAVVAELVKRGVTEKKAQAAEVAKVNGGVMPGAGDVAAWRAVLGKLRTANDPSTQQVAA